MGPYRAEERTGYWVLVDSRSSALASYPSTKRQARAHAKEMNRAWYQEASAAEQVAA